MFDPTRSPRLFAVPPGADFAAALVEGVLTRMAGQPPEATARIHLYLNSARMLGLVRAAFARRGAGLLPRMRLVTDIGRDPLAGLPPAVPPLRRRLELAQLVAGLLAQEVDFAPGTAMFDLADSLARLMDEMHGEGVLPEAFDDPRLAENHSAHWERSLRFIRIVTGFFAPTAPPDAEARQRLAVVALVAGWAKAPPAHPIIIAGSTGSRGATALLMRHVALLQLGAVVLPGFDADMPETAWTSLAESHPAAEDHPQYRYSALLSALAVGADVVRPWLAGAVSPDPARNRLISLALRPAPITDQWMAEGARLGDTREATRNLALIEAESPRAEAMAIASCLRDAAETGTSSALITPDRTLARRVAAALDRWGIVPDDSAGQPLGQTPPGRFLRHVAGLFGTRPDAERILTLLKHPLAATGAGERGNHLRFSRDLELQLRRKGPAFPTPADLVAWAQARKDDADRVAWARWLGAALTSAASVNDGPLAAMTAAHLALCEAIAAGPGGNAAQSQLWQAEAGASARAAMQELSREAGFGGSFSPRAYGDLLASVLGARNVRQSDAAHPLIKIRGTLEARARDAELVILAGLNEGIWPQPPAPDPWLSRQMRATVGLLLPERQIGLSAHDFQQAIAAPRVMLSRAIRDAEAETVPSRWLARLTSLLGGLPDQSGPQALEDMRARGAAWSTIAAAIEAPGRVPAALRPAPRPPVALRPRELPVTGIRTLIRDPYATYARLILRLRRLDPLRAEPDARLRGQILHRIVEDFIRDRPGLESEDAARARLVRVAEAVLTDEVPWPSTQRIWLTRIGRLAASFAAGEAARQMRGTPVILEESGAVTLADLGFTLTARPDRIDLLDDGRVHIYDYKSASPPTRKQQETFEKQLLLEAAMALRGGFAKLGPREVAAVTYIRLGGSGGEDTTEMTDALLVETWEDLRKLIAAYQRRETGYIARRAVFETRMAGDYDHLARHGEWQMSDAPAPEDVGDEA